jgi:hypothetical protein
MDINSARAVVRLGQVVTLIIKGGPLHDPLDDG